MKILFAIKNMNNDKGGAERVISFVVNGLVNKGYEVTFRTFDDRGLNIFYEIDKKIKRVSLGIGKSEQKEGFMETIGRIRAKRNTI